jgi:intein/homing endonuclease
VETINLSDFTGEVAAKVNGIIQSLSVKESVTKGEIVTKDSWGDSHSHRWSFKELGGLIADSIGRGCRFKHLPVWFWRAPREFQMGLFTGLIDTDGGVGLSHSGSRKHPELLVNYTTASFRLAQDIQLLAKCLHINARITPTKSSSTGNEAWLIGFSNSEIKALNLPLQDSEKRRKIEEATVNPESAVAARYDLVPMGDGLTLCIVKALEAVAKTKYKTAKWLKDCDPERLKTHDQIMALTTAMRGTKSSCKRSPGRISRVLAKRAIALLEEHSIVPEHSHWERWKTIVENTSVTWEYVTQVEKGKRETGYDLTVPGYETFVNVDGVVLSNTMNFNVPSTDAAIRDVVEIMMPSNTLKSTRDFRSPNFTPQMEAVAGLWAATAEPKLEKQVGDRTVRIAPKTFLTRKEAKHALLAGEIQPDDPIVILEP